MRRDFHEAEYRAGFEHVRSAMTQGLRRLPPNRHAGSYVIGAYCALVSLVWKTRDLAATRVQVGGILGAVLADVLRGEDQAPQDPQSAMLDAVRVAVAYSSPRDAFGSPQVDTTVVLDALQAYAAQLRAEAAGDRT